MLGGAESRNTPETFDRWFEAMLSTASLSSALCWACSKTSDPTSVSRRLRVERSRRRTPSWSSRSATRRLTVEVGILRRRAASEKLFASTTLAKIMSELRSVINVLPLLQVADNAMPVEQGEGLGRWPTHKRSTLKLGRPDSPRYRFRRWYNSRWHTFREDRGKISRLAHHPNKCFLKRLSQIWKKHLQFPPLVAQSE